MLKVSSKTIPPDPPPARKTATLRALETAVQIQELKAQIQGALGRIDLIERGVIDCMRKIETLNAQKR